MKKVFRLIGGIFKWTWKLINFIRLAIFNLFFLLIIGLIYVGFTQTSKVTAPPQVKEASALMLNLSGPIVEQRRYINPMDSFTDSLFGNEMPKENVLFDIVDVLRNAKDDEKVSGLILQLSEMSETNLTKLRYIAKAINEFKASGKPVYAIGDFYSQSQYYLASYADKIYLAPDGGVLLRGYGTYPLYYKTLLDKLDINTHVFRVGTYKSAIEPFIRDDMSKEAKESATAWLTQLWGAYVDDVASNRQIKPDAISPTMDQFLTRLKAVEGDLALLAQQAGLVDQLASRQEVHSEMITAFGAEGKEGFKSIGYYEYLDTLNGPYNFSSNDIAVVVASGSILDGKQPRGSVGGDTVAAQLRQARLDDEVKAVVLRVDSPGGSAFASEVIRKEVDAVKAAGKPVVVSMSSLAASGGYWIAMSADKIIAQPTTLTGSIGIFSVITTFEKGLNSIGVNSDGVGTTPFSGIGITRGISEQASEAIQLGIEHGYRRFIQLVGDSRNMSPDKVDKVAQGRVWTGYDAMNAGLVDQMGDFDDAIKIAAEIAGLEDYNIYWIEEPLSTTEQIFQQLSQNLNARFGLDLSAFLPKVLEPVAEQFAADTQLLSSLNDPKGYYALCLTCQIE